MRIFVGIQKNTAKATEATSEITRTDVQSDEYRGENACNDLRDCPSGKDVTVATIDIKARISTTP